MARHLKHGIDAGAVAALRAVGMGLLDDHVRHCVRDGLEPCVDAERPQQGEVFVARDSFGDDSRSDSAGEADERRGERPPGRNAVARAGRAGGGMAGVDSAPGPGRSR